MYRTDVYFICKTLAEAPIFLAIPLIFTVIVYPMIGLYPDVRHFFVAAAVLILVANVSTSFGNFRTDALETRLASSFDSSLYFIRRLSDILYQQQRDHGSLRWTSGDNTVPAVRRLLSKHGVSMFLRH